MDFSRATIVAKEAVFEDGEGNFPRAIELYSQAAELLLGVLRFEQDGAKRDAIRAAIDNYIGRAEKLKKLAENEQGLLFAGFDAPPVLPKPPSDSASFGPVGEYSGGWQTAEQSTSSDPTLGQLMNTVAKGTLTGLIVAGSTAKKVNEEYQIGPKVGAVAVATISKAKDVNDEYKVTDKVALGAKKTVETAAQINRDYRVVENVSGAVKGTVHAAVEMDKKYQIHQKIGTCAKATWVKAAEINDQYKITETAGRGLLAGLNWSAAQATKVLQSSQKPTST